MPLYKTITVDGATKAYVWKITETEQVLARPVALTENCERRLANMRSEAHRKAFLSIRHLLDLEGYSDADLWYDAMGKPHLRDGNFISITHSHNFAGIIIAKSKKVGIDIEMQRDKILRIAHKFTPIEEYRTLANTDALIRKLTIVWGCKEALYKIYAQPGLSFLRHIDIADFSLTALGTTGEIHYLGKTTGYTLNFFEFEGFTGVYAVES